jgi:hypothetical protein
MPKRHKAASGSFGSSPATTGYSNSIHRKAALPAQDAQQLEDVLLGVLELLVDEGSLSAWGLACLGSCSKACRSAAATLLKERVKFLLPESVKQAAETNRSLIKKKSIAAVQWLLLGAAHGRMNVDFLTTPATAAQFLSLNNIPPQLALALLQAGLRFSYKQLMQAVRARTAGVEVWVTAAKGESTPRARAVDAALRASLPAWVHHLCYNATLLGTFEQVSRLHEQQRTCMHTYCHSIYNGCHIAHA